MNDDHLDLAWFREKAEAKKDDEWRRTMGEIAQVARGLVGGRDINGVDYPSASIEDAAPLIARLRDLLDKYDRQMIEEARDD